MFPTKCVPLAKPVASLRLLNSQESWSIASLSYWQTLILHFAIPVQVLLWQLPLVLWQLSLFSSSFIAVAGAVFRAIARKVFRREDMVTLSAQSTRYSSALHQQLSFEQRKWQVKSSSPTVRWVHSQRCHYTVCKRSSQHRQHPKNGNIQHWRKSLWQTKPSNPHCCGQIHNARGRAVVLL